MAQASIPKSVVEIGDGVFKGCPRLEFIFGQHTSSDNKCLIINGRLLAIAPYGNATLAIPTGVTAIGDGTFWDCSKLMGVTIPASVTEIGEMAFMGCTALTQADLPEALATIGRWAYSGCTALQTVVLPKDLTAVGEYAFKECTSLVTVKSFVTDPNAVTLGEGVWGAAPPAACTLYVPRGTRELYETADDEQWRQFSSIEEFGDSGIETVNAASADDPSPVYYDLTGRRVLSPTPGLYITSGCKVLVK